MANILNKIIDHKKTEVESAKRDVSWDQMRDQVLMGKPVRDFTAALQTNSSVSLIAEVKKASPSKGIIRDDYDPVRIATIYAQSGASCISVLTDQKFFQGRLQHLTAIRDAIDLPILRKDFIIDSYQVYEARANGADAVLLIAECLDPNQLCDLHDEIISLNMTPLVEFFAEENLQKVLDANTRLIGINNRNLETFETDLMHCVRMRDWIPDDKVVVGESGIFKSADVAVLADARIDAMLVGESLMRANDIGQAVRALLSPI